MPHVEILTIGTELLLGSTLDGNSAFIGQRLAAYGLDCYLKQSVGDNRARISVAVAQALERSDGVITTGGLGPTVDDLTRDAVADVLGVELVLHQPSLQALESRLQRVGRSLTENNRRQAEIPAGATALPNPHGTAPGFVVLRRDGRFIAALPGVPHEMRVMLNDVLMPWLQQHYALRGGIVTRTLRTVGLPESELDRRIDDLFRTSVNPKIAVLAHRGFRVDVKLMAKVEERDAADALLAPLERDVRQRLGEHIYGVDDERLEERVVAELLARHRRLAVAESCTGGALADAIVSVPGASAVFLGGVVAYANAVKTRLLGVVSKTLDEQGAVSAATAEAMAEGALQTFGSDIALATTGVAGPDGGSAERPVGLVWTAIAATGRPTRTWSDRLSGDRSSIRATTVSLLLGRLLHELRTMEAS